MTPPIEMTGGISQAARGVLGRVEIGSDDLDYKRLTLRPKPETLATIEREAAANALAAVDGRNMLVGRTTLNEGSGR